MAKFWETASFAAVIGFVCGLTAGFFLVGIPADEFNKLYLEKVQLEQVCIGGNDRACRIYEVRYGR